MSIALIFILPLIVTALLFVPFIIKTKKGRNVKKAIIANLCAFFAVLSLCIAVPISVSAADEAATTGTATSTAATAEDSGLSDKAFAYIGAALAVGLGSLGCGIAVGKAAPAAIGAVSEDPSSFSKSLIFVALGEGVAIYGLLIAFLLIFQS
ncbi:MAG: ATP synthase subunit C [Ruminococcus sp.]|jgi:V/A-type H+-transporting ATPase subunit K|nr:ATP synthase subunit C [Ruminococcus sp.]